MHKEYRPLTSLFEKIEAHSTLEDDDRCQWCHAPYDSAYLKISKFKRSAETKASILGVPSESKSRLKSPIEHCPTAGAIIECFLYKKTRGNAICYCSVIQMAYGIG